MLMEKSVEWLAGETEVLEKTCHSATLSTSNPTCCLDANPGQLGGKPASNRWATARPTRISFVLSHFSFTVYYRLERSSWGMVELKELIFRCSDGEYCQIFRCRNLYVMGEIHRFQIGYCNSGIEKLLGGIHKHTTWRSYKPTFIFFKIRKEN
jgi:hypothetical protein